jgi:hypothetical protein
MRRKGHAFQARTLLTPDHCGPKTTADEKGSASGSPEFVARCRVA